MMVANNNGVTILEDFNFVAQGDTTPTADNMVSNGSFEYNVDNGTVADGFNKTGDAWVSDNNTGFEVWGNDYLGITTGSGNTFLELYNGSNSDSYSQNVNTVAGQHYSFSLDSMLRDASLVNTSGVEMLWNGEVVGTFTPGSDMNWEKHGFDVVGTGGSDTLTIRGLDTQDDGAGAFIDNVNLHAVDPVIQPLQVENLVIHNDTENQVVTGIVGDNNVFQLAGNANDYTISPTSDGMGVIVENNQGFDVLYDFNAITFADGKLNLVNNEPTDFVPNDLPNGSPTEHVYVDIASENQTINGDDNTFNTFKINGNSADYHSDVTTDGNGIVVWNDTNFDILYNIDQVAFNDQTLTSHF